MSTVSRYITSVRLTPQALNSSLIPFVSLLFLSGIPRVMDPLILGVWNWMFPTAMPTYLLTVGSIFGYLSVAAGLIKYFASDSLAEELRVQGEIKTFGPEDLPILIFYLGTGYLALLVFGVPITPITFAQTGAMLVLSLFYVTIPWYLHTVFSVPETAEDLATKTGVFVVTLILAVLATTASLVLIRGAGFYL